MRTAPDSYPLYRMSDAELLRELKRTMSDTYAISEAHKRERAELIVNLLHTS
ncbi:unnamed protein product [marine sediment metagenome]|uniref:Uncharacterized protein n=1 Tax=marine sediment metagenome TaxID=412755 RepID=X0VB63_9ZZZZ